MKIFIKILTSFLLILSFSTCSKDQPTETEQPGNVKEEPGSVKLFDKILFYDGYAETVSDPVPDGIYRIANSKYVTKLTDNNIAKIGADLSLEIVVEAACDNYDRKGEVFLSMMAKGVDYDQDNLAGRIEIGRFITPFMDKNKTPNEVPYSFDIPNIAKVLKDSVLNSKYDFWVEFDIFGVPYAANKEISGCAGKNYVFYGTITFASSKKLTDIPAQLFLPVASFQDLNNYKATDVIGQTVRTFNIDIPSAVENAKLFLITSSHGAKQGGEEYIRRIHNIYFDGNLVDSYIPGGISCEPYRKYNTQANGIYGRSAMQESDWASWSNWCPGQAIPIREYELDNLEDGTHTFKIDVPDAEFVGKDGQISLSVYVQGDKK